MRLVYQLQLHTIGLVQRHAVKTLFLGWMPYEMKTTRYSETSRTSHPATRKHITEELTLSITAVRKSNLTIF